MKNNTIDTSKMFEEYVVGESVNAVNGYAGIITGVEVNKSLVSNGIASQNDYIVTITILVDVEDAGPVVEFLEDDHLFAAAQRLDDFGGLVRLLVDVE